MSIHVSSEAEFRKWKRKARELRARAEHSPEDASIILEILGELDKLQGKYKKLDKRVRTVEAQVQKAYAAGYNRE